MKLDISTQMWAVVSETGHLNADPKYTRTAAIKDFMGDNASHKPWPWWKRKYGLRCIKVLVKITEAKK